MRIGAISVWFPVLYLRAEVTYRLLPELTPLHRALEAAVKQFSPGGNALAGAPIHELFSQLFGVSGAQEILPDVLDDLIERGCIHRVSDDEINPSLLRIVDLAPGQRGRGMARGANLPTENKPGAQKRKLERLFDPVLEEVVATDNLVPQQQDGHRYCIPVEPFLMNPPKDWIERELRAELNDDVQLYSADAELVDHRWRRSEAKIFLKDGELSIECGDPRESEYLRGLSQRVRQSWLLPRSVDGSSHSPVDEGGELSIHCQLPVNLGGLILTRGLPEAVRTELALPPSVVVVELDAATDITEPTLISTSSDEQAMQVAYPRNDNPGISGVFLASEGREFLRLPVIWEGLHAEMEVFRTTSGFQVGGSVWSDVIADLEAECRFSETPEIIVLPAFWLDPTDFWHRLSERSAEETDVRRWMAGIVKALKKIPYIALSGKVMIKQLEKAIHLSRLRQRLTIQPRGFCAQHPISKPQTKETPSQRCRHRSPGNI